jgi:hypothetical protein
MGSLAWLTLLMAALLPRLGPAGKRLSYLISLDYL